MQQTKAFWVTSEKYDTKNNLKPHLAEKKYMALIRDNKSGKEEFFFYDEQIDLEIFTIAYNYDVVFFGEHPQ